MLVTNIQWDTDGEYVELPSEVIIEEDIAPDEVADYLSDMYGWCIFSLEIADSDELADDITEEMFRIGFELGIVRITPPEIHDTIACEIGDNFFYFAAGGDELLSPEEYDARFGEGAALRDAHDVLSVYGSGGSQFRDEFPDEWLYYYYLLKEAAEY